MSIIADMESTGASTAEIKTIKTTGLLVNRKAKMIKHISVAYRRYMFISDIFLDFGKMILVAERSALDFPSTNPITVEYKMAKAATRNINFVFGPAATVKSRERTEVVSSRAGIKGPPSGPAVLNTKTPITRKAKDIRIIRK